MKLLPSGYYQVGSGEKIKISITKSTGPFAATLSTIIGSIWDVPSATPNGLTEENSFISPANSGDSAQCTLVYDFVPDNNGQYPPGDQYDVRIQGTTGNPDQFQIKPPPIRSTTLVFIVG